MTDTQFEQNFERLFNLMFEKVAKSIVSHATVKSVDKSKDTCVLSREDDAEMIDVRLKAIIDTNANKIIEYPKVNSSVLYVLIDNKKTEAVIIACSEVESVSLKVGDTSMLLNSNETVFNGGYNDGFIKIKELTTKLNSHIQEYNGFIALYNSHIHITTATPGASLVPGTISQTVSTASTAQTFSKSDYENTKIKH